MTAQPEAGRCRQGRSLADRGPVCPFSATRESGYCGHHDNMHKRRAQQAEEAGRRRAAAALLLRRAGAAATALTRLGIEAHPRVSGVLLTMDGAEDLVSRLITSTEGAAQ